MCGIYVSQPKSNQRLSQQSGSLQQGRCLGASFFRKKTGALHVIPHLVHRSQTMAIVGLCARHVDIILPATRCLISCQRQHQHERQRQRQRQCQQIHRGTLTKMQSQLAD